jgi:hypothetical protein
MLGAFGILLGVLVVSVVVVVVFMLYLRRGTFAKVEDVHGRLAELRRQHNLPTAALYETPDDSDGDDPDDPDAGRGDGAARQV